MEEQNHIEVDYFRSLIIPLLQEPGECTIVRKSDDLGVLLTLNVAQVDMGRMIGRAGETARSLRTLLKQFGMPHRMHINMKIEEPEGSTHQRREPMSDHEMVDRELADI